jgi:NTP pyrophosphatase (non-canonical NTP hydrolase)
MSERIYEAIRAERFRQDAKWGVQDHSPSYWFIILAEEIGEIAKAIYEGDYDNYEVELVQSASVIVAALETFHRKGLDNGNLPDRIASQPQGRGDCQCSQG